MNELARASVDALRERMPGNADTLYVMVFGSQARGDQRPDSDLDILHVVNRWCSKYNTDHYDVIRDAACGAPGGVSDVTVLVETPLTIQKYGNLYGTAEYAALREGLVVYAAGDAPRIHTYEMPASEAARRWQSRAYMYILYGRQMTKETSQSPANGSSSNLDVMWRMSVECSIKSVLCAEGVRFPFVRGELRRLHGLLPDMAGAVLDGVDMASPGLQDAERAYGAVRAFLGDDMPEMFADDDGLWDMSDILTRIADLD